MRKAIVGLVALLGLAGSGVALAAAKAKHHFTQTAVAVTESQTGTPPQAGSTSTAVEDVHSSPGGNGASVVHLSFTGPTGAPSTFAYRGSRSVYLAHGSLSGKVKATLTIEPDGSLKYAGTERVTGGTGLYRGATGKLTFTGTNPGGAKPTTTIHFTGSITY